MPKKRKQKVRFRKGDKKPGNYNMKLTYRKKMVKRGKKILWQVVEYPSKSIIAEKFFEEDARKQNECITGMCQPGTMRSFVSMA